MTTAPQGPSKSPQHDHSHPHKLSWTREISHFLLSGLASTASYVLVYPLETLKTRTQVHSECCHGHSEPHSTFREMRKHEGIRGFYRGLSAAIYHPMVCATSRLGLFFLFEDLKKRQSGQKVLSFLEKTYLSLAAGALGEIFVIPFDVIYVRYQADGGLPVAQRRGYTGVFNAFHRIIAEEGVLTLWRGTVPSIAKCMSVNFGMLTPYYECKERLAKYMGHTKANYLLSAALAGIGASIITLPVDNVKVKLQKMKGKEQYKGVVDCIKKTYKNEGVRGYWAGLVPFYLFFAPHVMLTLLFNDYLRINTKLCHC